MQQRAVPGSSTCGQVATVAALNLLQEAAGEHRPQPECRPSETTSSPGCTGDRGDNMETPEGFRIVRAQPSDRDRVERLARTAFYPDEPMNVALGNTRGPPTDQLLFLSALDEPHSLIAEDASTGEAVGMCINGIVSPEVHEKKKQLQPQDEVLRTVLHVLRTVWAEADVWSQTAARSALEVRILAVASSARGRGLAAALLAESLRMAKEELRLPLALILCTSAFSAKLSRQAGMRLVYEKPYCQTDMPAQPPQPHDRIAIYMKDLQG